MNEWMNDRKTKQFLTKTEIAAGKMYKKFIRKAPIELTKGKDALLVINKWREREEKMIFRGWILGSFFLCLKIEMFSAEPLPLFSTSLLP